MLAFSCDSDKKKPANESGDSALDALSKAIENAPQKPDLYHQRAIYLYKKKGYEEAMLDMQKAITLDSLKPQYYHTLSDIQLDYYKSRQALTTMEVAAHLFPKRVATLLKLSETQFILKQYDASVQTINDILAFEPQNAEAYFMLGMNFREEGGNKRAIAAFQTAVENDPDLMDGWLIIAEIYAEEGDFKAVQYYDNAIRVNPQSVEALHGKAFFLQNNDRIPEALDIYEQITLLDPNYEPIYLNRGILFIEIDSLDRAREEFDILINIKPQNHLGHYYRGIVNQMLNRLDQAKIDFENAVNLAPDFDRAQEALTDLKQKIQ